MGKSLVIVESPAKARTINKYLGRDFVVKSSVGHIRDLPTSGSGKPVDPVARAKAAAITRKLSPKKKAAHKKKKAQQALIARMGINPDKNWKAHYEILPGKEKVVTELRKLANQADTIYLATDLDREGEAIAWHLREVIGGDKSRFKRVVFNEITKTAIQQAFEDPGKLDQARVDAQQARRFLDRVVGYMLSPLLWARVARGLSAGRVQSVAVRLIVEREGEIRAFVPEEYWEIYADTRSKRGEDAIRLQVAKENGAEFRPGNAEQADAAVAKLREATYVVTDRTDRNTSTKPGAPYITSTLQQAASTRLGFSVKKTMMLAQRLYEAGHITYMRTDSTNLSKEAVEACREFVQSDPRRAYLPEELDQLLEQGRRPGGPRGDPAFGRRRRTGEHRRPRTGPGAALLDDLEAVRRLPDAARALQEFDADHHRRRLRAEDARPHPRLRRTHARAAAFRQQRGEPAAAGRRRRFDARARRAPSGPALHEAAAALRRGEPRQGAREARHRSSVDLRLDHLDHPGSGLRAPRQPPLPRGEDRATSSSSGSSRTSNDLMDYDFTAELEESLDEVALGDKEWKKVLDDFYEDFKKKIEARVAEDAPAAMRANAPTDTDIECPKCGRHMQVRTASTGVFLGCSGYALPPKERCKSTINLISGDEAVSADAEDQEELESRLQLKKHDCPKCKTKMDSYLIDETRKLHVCGDNPDCDGFQVETGQFVIKGYDGPVLECDRCGHDMQLKSGRFGKYFGCTSEDCKNTRKLLRNGEPAPPKVDPIPMPHLACEKCDDFYLLRDGAAGIFLAASQFPKHRETRAPLVEEVLQVKDQLDEKYQFLTTAPTEDREGNKATVRFLRKTREQYVMTDVDGKATGWRAFYQDGKWVEELPPPKSIKKKKAARKKAGKRKAAKSKAAPKKASSKKAARKKSSKHETTVAEPEKKRAVGG